MPNPSRLWRFYLPAAALLLASLTPYAETWFFGFIYYDDWYAIVDLDLIRELSWERLPAFFQPDVRPRLAEYMPLKNLSYAVDYAIFGLSGKGFRLQQHLWYATAVLLMWLWIRAVLLRLEVARRPGLPVGWAGWAESVAFVCALLYAVHPAHVESVVWLSGRKDVLSGAFMPACLLCALLWPGFGIAAKRHQHLWLVGASGAAAWAVLSKPMAVTLPALLLMQDLLLAPRGQWLAVLRRRALLHLAVGAVVAAFLVLYLSTVASVGTAIGEGGQWREFRGPAWIRWGQQLGAFAWLSVLPDRLAPMYPPDLMDPRLLSWRAIGGLMWIAALVAGGLAALWRGHALTLGIGLFAIPLVPIVFSPPWAQYFAGRYLFHAVLGLILILALFVSSLLHKLPRVRRPFIALLGSTAAAIMTLTWGLGTHHYAKLWKDDLTLWTGAAASYPDFAAVQFRAAEAALRQGNKSAALYWSQRCSLQRPEEARCAAIFAGLIMPSDPKTGESTLRRSLPHDRTGAAHLALAHHLANTGQPDRALRLLGGWLHGRNVTSSQLKPLVALALRANKPDKALETARQLVALAANEFPASPPDVELLMSVAKANRDDELSKRIRAAAKQCSRNDCLRRRLGW